jgi:hypothetical protein
MLPKVLFITERWPRNNPSIGQTSLYYTLFASLQEANLARIALFHPDEWLVTRGEPLDCELLTIVAQPQYCPDIIVYSWLSPQSGEPELIGNCNPKLSTWVRIKAINPNIKLCAIWGDSAWKMSQLYLNKLINLFDLQLTLDLKHPEAPSNVMALWTYPYASDLFTGDPQAERLIDVSFIGSVEGRPERIKVLKELENRGVTVSRFGGQLEENLSFEEYASIFRQSKISLNIATITSKGRAKESLLCGSCLFEPETSATKDWVVPNKDYIAYKMNGDEPDYDELAKQIQYYLANPKNRIKVASTGHKTVWEKYSGKQWWISVLDKLGFKEHHPTYTVELNSMEAIVDQIKHI